MPFIRIFPLQETEAVRPEDFGCGNPARCHAVRRLADGGMLVVPDDPDEDEPGFAAALEQAAGGWIAEMGYSRYLEELTRTKLI